MDETKECLQKLVDFLSKQYATGLINQSQVIEQVNTGDTDTNSTEDDDNLTINKNEPDNSANIITKQNIQFIIKTLNLCKQNITHFGEHERIYLMPVMTLCGHILLTETHLMSRIHLKTISETLAFVLQFLVNLITLYYEESDLYDELNIPYMKKLSGVKLSNDNDEFYRYFIKKRLMKFLSFMLLEEKYLPEDSKLTNQDLITLCQMLTLKPMPDSLRLYLDRFETEEKTNTQITSINSPQFGNKRIRLTQKFEINCKDEFFDQLLTPMTSNIPAALSSSSSSSLSSNTSLMKPKTEIDELAAVIDMYSSNKNEPKTYDVIESTNNQSNEVKSYLISHNQMYFQYIGGSNSMLNFINKYTFLRPFILHLLALENGASYQLLFVDESSFDLICDCLYTEIDLLDNVVNLNQLLEPFSCDRISTLIVTAQACLNACISLIYFINHDSQLETNETELAELTKSESLTLKIIEKSCTLYNKVFETFRQSNRVPGEFSQNAHMFTSWMLFNGLEMVLRSKSLKNTNKRQQGYSTLCVPMMKHAIKVNSHLLDDIYLELSTDKATVKESLKSSDDYMSDLNCFKKAFLLNPPNNPVESVNTTPNTSPTDSGPGSPKNTISGMNTGNTAILPISTPTTSGNSFKYDKFAHYSSWERIEMLVSSNINIVHLLFSYISAGYRRASLLYHSSNRVLSNMVQMNIDLLTTKDKNIKKKLKERLTLYEIEKKCAFDEQNNVKEKFEICIDNHYELVIFILDHLNYFYVCSKIDGLRTYFKQVLTDAQIIVLAHIIQDLDSELENYQTLTSLSKPAFNHFASSLSSFIYNLIAMQILSEEQQNSLLAYIGFKPSIEPCSLHHGARSLAILAQIILLRLQKEQEDMKTDLNAITIQIWRGFINKLTECALDFNGEMAPFNKEYPDYQEDLNVEHAQLMLFFFHNLKLLQRKHVFCSVGLALNEIAVKLEKKSSISPKQILFIGRILHLFEYMCKNLYDTPEYLFEQIRHNLLNLNEPSKYLPFLSSFFVKSEWQKKFPDAYRRVKFFPDRKLESNFFEYLKRNYRKASEGNADSKTTTNEANFKLNYFDFLMHPRFYYLMDVNIAKGSSARTYKPKLDGIACNFMLAGFNSVTYDQFYNSLLNMMQIIATQYEPRLRDITSDLPQNSQVGSFGLCTIDYTFGTLWRLLNQLPPSLQYLQDISNILEPSIQDQEVKVMNASRIMNMCIWMPRFEHNLQICTWVADLLSKAGNIELNDGNSSTVSPKLTSTYITSFINELSEKLSSLEFNYCLLKNVLWSFFCYDLESNSKNLNSCKEFLQRQQMQPFPANYQLPTFFTLLTADIYLDRLIYLFNNFELKNFSKINSNATTCINQDLLENYLSLLIGLYDKFFQDVNLVLLDATNSNFNSEINYHINRSLANLCSARSADDFDTWAISSIIFSYLPNKIQKNVEQWDEIYVNNQMNVMNSEYSTLFQKLTLFELPLIEMPSISSDTTETTTSLTKFSSYLNEECFKMPNLTSFDSSPMNIGWIKLKQFYWKLFKFCQNIYGKRDLHQRTDPFLISYMFESNLISENFLGNQHGNFLSDNALPNEFKSINNFKEMSLSILYPYFIGNAFFLLTIFDHPLYENLNEKNVVNDLFYSFQDSFAKFFILMLKKSYGKLAFEEFLCDDTPSLLTISKQNAFQNYSLLNLIQVTLNTTEDSKYAVNIMKIIKTLLSQSEQYPDDISLVRLCSELSSAMADYPDHKKLLFNWFNQVLFIKQDPNYNLSYNYKFNGASNTNLYLLFKFIYYIIKGTSRFNEVVLISMADALFENIQILITDTYLDELDDSYLFFNVLFTSLIYLISSIDFSLDSNSPQANQPYGHFKLIQEVIKWLEYCKTISKTLFIKSETEFTGKHRFIAESCFQMFAYLSDIFSVFEYKYLSNQTGAELTENGKKDEKKESSKKMFIDEEKHLDDIIVVINDSNDDLDYEDETELAEQLCTFTRTQKEFMNQHWYHCHTCKMLDGVGVCSVCAKVCHQNHDVTYSKFGSFFCDCGAKEDNSCKALVKRQVAESSKSANKKKKKTITKPSIDRNKKQTVFENRYSLRLSKYWYKSFYSNDLFKSKLSDNYKMSKNKYTNHQTMISKNCERYGLKYENLDQYSYLLMSNVVSLLDNITSIAEFFIPLLENFYQNNSDLGFSSRIKKKLEILQCFIHRLELKKSETLLTQVKCWQEPLFDSIDMAVTEPQSHHFSFHVQRNAMMVLGNCNNCPIPNQQYPTYPNLLAIVNDKNINIFQLDQLLGQLEDNSRKKYQLEKISTITFQFSIIYMAKSPYNQFIAVCSWKDCHIVTLAKNGSVTGHFSLLSLDNNNHIKKVYWLPDKPAELVIVTLDFVKIYDLSDKNYQTSVHVFVIPMIKISDVTFYSCQYNEEWRRFLLILTYNGVIYVRELTEAIRNSETFFVTQIIDVDFPEKWNGKTGFSIYYSHLLQMLFVGYLCRYSFCCSFDIQNIFSRKISNILSLESSKFTSSGITDLPFTLYQWDEVLSHPGLIFASTTGGITIAFMFKLNKVKYQVIKFKKKIADFATISTVSKGNDSLENNTPKMATLLLLLEDGSLRFQRALNSKTNYWLKPNISNLDDLCPINKNDKSGKPVKLIANEQTSGSLSGTSNKTPKFSVDFFERCSQMNEVEFGGSDVLEVYNTLQIKTRFNAANMYIACTKPNGFTLTVTQIGDYENVMAGIRVNLGVCDPARAPTSIEVFNRSTPVNITRNRWFDIPFTLKEMKKLIDSNTFDIRFVGSNDSNHVTIVDCVRVYGRSRELVSIDNEELDSTFVVSDISESESVKICSKKKSPTQKLRALLYAPDIADIRLLPKLNDEDHIKYGFVISHLMANSLDVLESLISFIKLVPVMGESTNEVGLIECTRHLLNSDKIGFKQKCELIINLCSKLLNISFSGRLNKSACLLLAKLIPHKTQYDEHRCEIIFENSFQYIKCKYDDLTIYNYYITLFCEMVSAHPRIFIRLINKYFNEEKTADSYLATAKFCQYLFDIFLEKYQKRPFNEMLCCLSNIGQFVQLDSIVNSLVVIFYSSTYSLLMNNSEIVQDQTENSLIIMKKATELIVRMLFLPEIQISFATKKAMFNILNAISNGLGRSLMKRWTKLNTKLMSIASKNRERKQSEKQLTGSQAATNRSTENSSQSNVFEQSSSRGNRTAPRRQTSRRMFSSIRGTGSSSTSRASNSNSNQNSQSDSVQSSLLDRLSNPLLNPYMMMDVDNNFSSFQDLINTLRLEQEVLEGIYEPITENDDEEEEEDDDDDEDEELDDDNAGLSERFSNEFEEENRVQDQSALDMVLNEDNPADEEEEDHNYDEDDEDEFDGMDEDEMMEIAIALSLQESQRNEADASIEEIEYDDINAAFLNGQENLEAILGTLRTHFQQIQTGEMLLDNNGRPSSSNNEGGSSAAADVLDSGASLPQPSGSENPLQSTFHSESEDDDEELYDDENKLADTTMESVDAEEEHDEIDDDESNLMETSQSSLKSTKSISKSNETITKRSSHHSPSIALNQSIDHTSKEKTGTKKKDSQKNRKSSRRLFASKFCVNLLKELINSLENYYDSSKTLNGMEAIPSLQILTIMADFNYVENDDKEFANYFNLLIVKMIDFILKPVNDMDNFDKTEIETLKSGLSSKRIPIHILYQHKPAYNANHEFELLLLRFLCLFLSNFKRFPGISWKTFLNKDLPLNESFRSKLIQYYSKSSGLILSEEETKTTGSKSPYVKNTILIITSQLIYWNRKIFEYCFAMLHHLLKNFWQNKKPYQTGNDSDKNKTPTNGSIIEYNTEQGFNYALKNQFNFIPSDLLPFFTTNDIQNVSSPSQHDLSGIMIINYFPNRSCNPLNSYAVSNSAILNNYIFENYSELLTEIALRIPYQLKKMVSYLNNQSTDKNSKDKRTPIKIDIGMIYWIETLCEYMILPSVSPYIRKQVRKLLSNLCGSKDRYRQVRDYYAVKRNMRSVRRIIVEHFFVSNGSNLALKLQDLGMTEQDLEDDDQLDQLIRIIINTIIENDSKNATLIMSADQHRLLNLPYEKLIDLVEYLKACMDIAVTRVQNWQRLCRRDTHILPFLFRISFLFGEGIASLVLQLINMALFNDSNLKANANKKTDETILINSIESKAEKSNEKTSKKDTEQADKSNQEYICNYIFVVLDRTLFQHFVRFFLLESNCSQQRWATHSMLYMLFDSLHPAYQEQMLSLFWELWPKIASYGKRASQFVDLLGYFTLVLSKNEPTNRMIDNEKYYAQSAMGLLRFQNQVLLKHPNSNLYNSLKSLLDLNGYYLETEPCLVCNNPEVNFTQTKLSSIKMDSRYTTNTHIVKLIGVYTISKIVVKISELKKSKMVKTLSIFYNNRWVHSVVELKNKNTVWYKAKCITLTPSQSEVKIEFTLPIVACNLMIEYTNFYDGSHYTPETLQCPRCSSTVLANPGVCSNCGENVFQCHKCRAINYDERDPFLCNSCGFCKYAKFDYILTARFTASAVEKIENEEDRTKAVQTINTLLEKADRLYRTILSIRPTLEYLVLQSYDYNLPATGESSDQVPTTSNSAASGTAASPANSNPMLNVNRYVCTLANRYSTDCRIHFEELSKIVQKMLYSRKELVDYDNKHNDNKQNFEDIKRILQELRHDTYKKYGSTTSLSSTSSSTLVDVSASTSTKKHRQPLSSAEEHYEQFDVKKPKLSNEKLDNVDFDFKSGRCYGCANATIEHCIILLKALVHNPRFKTIFISSNLFKDLINYNLRVASPPFQRKIISLLCMLIRDDMETTKEFSTMLLQKISTALETRYLTSLDFTSIHHEMSLLSFSFEKEDNCWETRLRCVIKLFLLSLENKSPAVLEAVTVPCLRILHGLITKQENKSETSKNVHPEQTSLLKTEKLTSNKFTTKIPADSFLINVSINLNQWLAADNKTTFKNWKQRNLKMASISDYNLHSNAMDEYLERKYFTRWLSKYQLGEIRNAKTESFIVRIASSNWIQEVLFNPTSKSLRGSCRQLLLALFERLTHRQRELIDLFTSFLDNLCEVGGEIGMEFYDLYRSIIFGEFSSSAASNIAKNSHWRYYLTLCGLLQYLCNLISKEIERLKELENSTLSSNFYQGSALRQLVELLQLFMRDERIRRIHKSSMVGAVLDGYLSLRKLIVQRTKMIDETQAALLEFLELLTTGTKAETINFMKVCIESVKKCSLQDYRTPVFIFERLCSIIHPEEKDADEFFISLDKDPAQEDFLQGRMLGNPYSSKDAGMGPLMRNIKNKICQECELVSLLEDDSGLELLVNNKIISLDLPVKEVYKKIVCADAKASKQPSSNPVSHSYSDYLSTIGSTIFALDPALATISNTASSSTQSSRPTMKIIYRIRGLMGDATEEFIETLADKDSIVKDDEKLFELANIMSQSNGLNVMLERLNEITEINNQTRNVLIVLLKLFGYCVRVSSNRQALIQPEMNAIGIMLGIVRLFLASKQADLLIAQSAPGQPSYFEQLLTIMETLLAEASKELPEVFDKFNNETCGNSEDIQSLIDALSASDSLIFTSNVISLNNKILRVITFLCIGHPQKMSTLINNFRPYFEFDEYDIQLKNIELDEFDGDLSNLSDRMKNPDYWCELFCSMVAAIEPNHNGARLKDLMIKEGFVALANNYLVTNAPEMKSFVQLNSEEWKKFASRPALKYVLKMLTGMGCGHEPTQLLITEAVPILHSLEQVLSDSRLATLAENLMEVLRENPSVEAKIQEIRLKTKEEKKRIAMAVREKQLGELGMIANDKGQVMADSSLLKKMEGELNEEKGLICSICREGYSYQPQKVLAIYTFTKRCNVDEFEDRSRKTIGYTTVTHFNIIHVECHMDAVRHARSRDEWQSASLHNANTRCNGFLPLWGPNVYESLFAHALSRHNSYLQEAVGQRDFVGNNSFMGTIHDLKLLLLRFANEKSFSEETGGGGAQSNLYLTPYLIHTALYVMNTTKVVERERSNFEKLFMKQNRTKALECCLNADSPFFYATMVLFLHSHNYWSSHRIYFLKRLILCQVARSLPKASREFDRITNTEPTYSIIKPALMFFALINLFYTIMFKNVEVDPDDNDWSISLCDYIRHNDQHLLEAADKILNTFENDILLSTSFGEFCDAIDLLRGKDAITDTDQFLKDAINLSNAN